MWESLIFDVVYVHVHLSGMWDSSLSFLFSLEHLSSPNTHHILYKNRQKVTIWYYNFDANLCLCSFILLLL